AAVFNGDPVSNDTRESTRFDHGTFARAALEDVLVLSLQKTLTDFFGDELLDAHNHRSTTNATELVAVRCRLLADVR
ncbi:unnamed protein product, partial [Ixodes pacificus]